MVTTGRAQPSGKWAKAWRGFVEQAAREFGAPWVLCGKGGRSFVAAEPVGWWLSRVGYDPARDGSGYLFAAQQPLTIPWSPSITLRQDECVGDDVPRPGFEPWAEDADYVFRWWINGPARAHLTEHTDQEWFEQVSREFEIEPEFRPIRWPMLAGFRVIYDRGPAEPVIDAVLAVIDADQYLDDERPWWEEFRTVVTTSSRSEVLRWLDGQRRAGLASAGVPDSAIADVLSGVV